MSVSGKPQIVCIDPNRIDDIWPHVRPFIKAALYRGDMGLFEDLESDVLTGDALLWAAWNKPYIEAAAVTQIVRTERSKVCMIQACGGRDPKRWIGLIGRIEEYAKEQGCRCTRIIGRRGWSRLLQGYRTTKVVLERQL